MPFDQFIFSSFHGNYLGVKMGAVLVSGGADLEKHNVSSPNLAHIICLVNWCPLIVWHLKQIYFSSLHGNKFHMFVHDTY